MLPITAEDVINLDYSDKRRAEILYKLKSTKFDLLVIHPDGKLLYPLVRNEPYEEDQDDQVDRDDLLESAILVLFSRIALSGFVDHVFYLGHQKPLRFLFPHGVQCTLTSPANSRHK